MPGQLMGAMNAAMKQQQDGRAGINGGNPMLRGGGHQSQWRNGAAIQATPLQVAGGQPQNMGAPVPTQSVPPPMPSPYVQPAYSAGSAAAARAAGPVAPSNPYTPQAMPFPSLDNERGFMQRPAGMAGPTNTGIHYSPGPTAQRLASQQTSSARPNQVVPQAAGTPGPYPGSMYGAGGTLFMTPDATDPQFRQPQAQSQQQRDAAFYQQNPQALQRQIEGVQQQMAGGRAGNQDASYLPSRLAQLQSYQGAAPPRTVNYAAGSATMPTGGSVTYGGAPVTRQGQAAAPIPNWMNQIPGAAAIQQEANRYYGGGEQGPTPLMDQILQGMGMGSVSQFRNQIMNGPAYRAGR